MKQLIKRIVALNYAKVDHDGVKRLDDAERIERWLNRPYKDE